MHIGKIVEQMVFWFVLYAGFPPSHFFCNQFSKKKFFPYKFPSLVKIILKDICCKYCKRPTRIFCLEKVVAKNVTGGNPAYAGSYNFK